MQRLCRSFKSCWGTFMSRTFMSAVFVRRKIKMLFFKILSYIRVNFVCNNYNYEKRTTWEKNINCVSFNLYLNLVCLVTLLSQLIMYNCVTWFSPITIKISLVIYMYVHINMSVVFDSLIASMAACYRCVR